MLHTCVTDRRRLCTQHSPGIQFPVALRLFQQCFCFSDEEKENRKTKNQKKKRNRTRREKLFQKLLILLTGRDAASGFSTQSTDRRPAGRVASFAKQGYSSAPGHKATPLGGNSSRYEALSRSSQKQLSIDHLRSLVTCVCKPFKSVAVLRSPDSDSWPNTNFEQVMCHEAVTKPTS